MYRRGYYPMTLAIAYYRVSRPKQGVSGLGLEAQQERVRNYARHNGITIVKEVIEVESGLKKTRPLVNEVIALCKSLAARILIASQDRLARSVLFFALLMDSKIPFTNVESPNDSELVINLKAAIDQDECRKISERTKAALAAAKRRGVVLGKTCHELHRRKRLAIQAFTQKMTPIIEELREKGIRTVRAIMGELIRRKIPPFMGDGYRWHITSVYNLLLRIDRLKAQNNQHQTPTICTS